MTDVASGGLNHTTPARGMLKAVTFDLWQTLILDTPEGVLQARAERVRGIHEILARQGLVVNARVVEQAFLCFHQFFCARQTIDERLDFPGRPFFA